MYIGVDYYPEHWSKSKWPTYAKWMKQAGFNVVRLAEFAWVKMEPKEGTFDFAWLDEALQTLHAQGISAILGTPTAAMPAWVARKYPETLATSFDGQRMAWGVRKNNCFSSGTFRLLSERVTTAMAKHYGSHPAVIGWQTDNEFTDPNCFCVSCRNTWQDWLREKYGSLDRLNQAWGTHFWGHTYQTWGEIQMTPPDMQHHNPSLCLDWKRFQSSLNTRFQADQIRILRKLSRGKFITHNLMGLSSGLDYWDLAKDLDHVSWDNYPIWGKPEVSFDAAAGADVMRGLKRKNPWIMEQTAGPHGWVSFARNPRPGEIRKVSFQQVGRGADGLVWFRWRTATTGREQYWHGLLGHDGKLNRRYREAAKTAKDLHKIAKELEGTTPKPKVAMYYDYENIWAFDIQPGYGGSAVFSPTKLGNNFHNAMKRWYRALFRAGINVDMIKPGQDLKGYSLVLAPHQYLMPDTLARQLSDYVKAGGVLVTDCRTGVKDETNLCHERTLPGLLSQALGIAIEEYDALDETTEHKILGSGGLEGEFSAVWYTDWIKAQGAEVLATYGDWHLKGFAAATKNRFGKGTAFYVGAVAKEEEFYDKMVALALRQAKIEAEVVPVEGVEVSVRQGRGRKLCFLVNHTEETKEVSVPSGKKELLNGGTTGVTIELEPFGVRVIKL